MMDHIYMAFRWRADDRRLHMTFRWRADDDSICTECGFDWSKCHCPQFIIGENR